MGESFAFLFQAEDGIRDVAVTGVQTCALPISNHGKQTGTPPRMALPDANTAYGLMERAGFVSPAGIHSQTWAPYGVRQIGRASCRERVKIEDDDVSYKKNARCHISRSHLQNLA